MEWPVDEDKLDKPCTLYLEVPGGEFLFHAFMHAGYCPARAQGNDGTPGTDTTYFTLGMQKMALPGGIDAGRCCREGNERDAERLKRFDLLLVFLQCGCSSNQSCSHL